MGEVYVSKEDAIAGADPRFDAPSKVHDWRNHVGERTKALWETFTREQRAAIINDADDSAGAEHWD